jgi:L-fucose isomerase
MGIAGSIVDHNFFESWLGMKVQAVDMTELRRRIDQKIYDETELEMALAWADKTSATAKTRTRSSISAMKNRAARC